MGDIAEQVKLLQKEVNAGDDHDVFTKIAKLQIRSLLVVALAIEELTDNICNEALLNRKILIKEARRLETLQVGVHNLDK